MLSGYLVSYQRFAIFAQYEATKAKLYKRKDQCIKTIGYFCQGGNIVYKFYLYSANMKQNIIARRSSHF